MHKFRLRMKQELAERLQILRGVTTPSAVQFKKDMLRLFVAHGGSIATRQMLLIALPNGDWRSRDVQHFVAPGAHIDREAILKSLTAGIMYALASAQPPMYPRRRWTGSDLACDSLGILEACHQLLSTSMRRFVLSFMSPGAALQLSNELDRRRAAGQHWSATALLALEDLGDVPNRDALAAAAAGQPGVADSSGAAATNDFARVNAMHRREALTWTESDPLGPLIVIRLVMEPLRKYLKYQLDTSAEEWELAEQGRLAQALRDGEPLRGARRYRLSEAALGHHEEELYRQVIHLLRTPEMWTCVPQKNRAVEFRAMAFMMASRVGCAVEQLLRHDRRQCAVRMFGVLADERVAEEIEGLPFFAASRMSRAA